MLPGTVYMPIRNNRQTILTHVERAVDEYTPSNNSLVNCASCVCSSFFVDLMQLMVVLAIAKPNSPALHHHPTTIKHTSVTPTSL